MTSRLSQSYLLRLWREQVDAPLHATLVPVGRPEAHQHFDLDALLAFLRQQAGEDPNVNDDWNTNHCTSSKSS